MKIGILQEGEYTGISMEERYHQIIKEVVLADELGFSTYGSSEQHFFPDLFSLSAPEVFYAALAMKTKQIKFRPMGVVALNWNHPIVIAERLATLDLLSGGRAELCTVRSNNIDTLRVFGVDPESTREVSNETVEALMAIFKNPDEVEYHGRHWNFPKTTVIPQTVGKRFPALSMAATSVESHVISGERGIGVISFEQFFGFDFLQECIDTYRSAVARTTAEPQHLNDYVGLYVGSAYCAPTMEQAKADAGDVALAYFQLTLQVNRRMAANPSYKYMDRINTMVEHGENLDWLVESTSSIMIGTPETFIARLKDLEARGANEVLLRIDSFGHEKNLAAIELIGREVIPEFR